MTNDIMKVLLSKEVIEARVVELGREITEKFEGTEPLFIGVLKGSYVFMADLMRHVNLKCSMDFMAVSSYGSGTTSSGAVKINKDLNEDITDRHIIIVEDILDSGITLTYLCGYLQNRKPASITLVTLLDKPARRKAPTTTHGPVTGLGCSATSSRPSDSLMTSSACDWWRNNGYSWSALFCFHFVVFVLLKIKRNRSSRAPRRQPAPPPARLQRTWPPPGAGAPAF